MAGFTKTQHSQLKELFDTQQAQLSQLVDVRFDAQQSWMNNRFQEERLYFKALLKQELSDIREKIGRLDERSDEDVTATMDEVTKLKKRLAKVEKAVAKLS